MMMVSEQMPTTSDYIPLFGLFYLSIIFIIFIGTLFTAFILNVHLQKTHNKPIPPLISYLFFHKIAPWLSVRPPTTLAELWQETGVRIRATSSSCNQNSPQKEYRKRVCKLIPEKNTDRNNNNNNNNNLLGGKNNAKLLNGRKASCRDENQVIKELIKSSNILIFF